MRTVRRSLQRGGRSTSVHVCAHVYRCLYINEGGRVHDPCKKGKHTRMAAPELTPKAGSWHCTSVRAQRITPVPTPPVTPDSIRTLSNTTWQLCRETAERLDMFLFSHSAWDEKQKKGKRFVASTNLLRLLSVRERTEESLVRRVKGSRRMRWMTIETNLLIGTWHKVQARLTEITLTWR